MRVPRQVCRYQQPRHRQRSANAVAGVITMKAAAVAVVSVVRLAAVAVFLFLTTRERGSYCAVLRSIPPLLLRHPPI